uniref:Seven TM Receptor n=1 Tax=Caenorhabditis tropicalis TaxID=1561998 RepID=A0A1I7T7L4_9PELO
MTRFFVLSDTFTKLGVFTASFSNFFLIYLTIFHIKQIGGTFKYMVLVLALTGIAFSSWELIARPFTHNYNRAFILFSLNTWILDSEGFLQVAVAIYAGFYLFILAFFAEQFVFRYLSLVNPLMTKAFGGFGVVGWIGYPFLCGVIYCLLLLWSGDPDQFSDDYLRFVIESEHFIGCVSPIYSTFFRETFADIYGMNIETTARFIFTPYAADDSFRWRNLSFMMGGGFLLTSQYFIIMYCGVRMHLAMRKELGNFSVPNRRLQKQFFRALIVQTLVPTCLFVLPALPILLGPLFDFEWNVQTGGIMALLSIYPPIDTFVFIMIVSEYRRELRVPDICQT